MLRMKTTKNGFDRKSKPFFLQLWIKNHYFGTLFN